MAMELLGGVMIMLVLLSLLFGAVWLSLPILIIGLWRRLERLTAQMERVETRLAHFERQLALRPAHETTTHATTMPNVDTQGGIDGTVDR
jgi:type II secretory pathway component PulJ